MSARINIDLPSSGEYCVGRESQLRTLNEIWSNGSKKIISIIARGGEGKTTLVQHWLNQLALTKFAGAKAVFARSFYSQGTGDRIASADSVIDEALRFFGQCRPERLSPYDRGVELARLVGEDRNLLILDGMEPLQYPPGPMGGEIKDPGLEALVKSMQFASKGLCIITTREEIRPLQGVVNHEEVVLQRLSTPAARQLLHSLGVSGDQDAIGLAIEENHGHALAITLLGTYLVERFGGDIAHIKRIAFPFGFDDAPTLPSTELLKGRERESNHARKMIGSYEKWFQDEPDEVNRVALVVLRFMGLFNRPPESRCIVALRDRPIKRLSEALFTHRDCEETWRKAILRLERARLVTRRSQDWNEIDCHPLIREYFAEQLAELHSAAARECHRRLYQALKQGGPEFPDNLKDMMPLYHAVSHACKANLHQAAHSEVYFPRIRRGHADYALKHLGAAGMELACAAGFFLQPWTHPVKSLPRDHQLSLVSVCGFLHKYLGKYDDARTIIQVSLEGRIHEKLWAAAANDAVNLSEICTTLGDFAAAMLYGEQSIELADRCVGSKSWHGLAMRTASRATLATALHLAGARDEAAMAFEDAELRENEAVGSRFLRSTSGYAYCDLLLDEVDQLRERREATQRQISKIRTRANSALRTFPNTQLTLIDEGLNNLTLGRTYLAEYREVPVHGEQSVRMQGLALRSAERYLDISLSALRQAGNADDLPRILLGWASLWRACCEICLNSQVPQRQAMFEQNVGYAERDLFQAESIAKRGSMLVWQIEAALECARLNFIRHKFVGGHGSINWRDRAWLQIEVVKSLIKQTEKAYQPFLSESKIGRLPKYVGVFKRNTIVGYHCRNDEIAQFERLLKAD